MVVGEFEFAQKTAHCCPLRLVCGCVGGLAGVERGKVPVVAHRRSMLVRPLARLAAARWLCGSVSVLDSLLRWV